MVMRMNLLSREKRDVWLVAGLCLATVFLSYGNTLFHGFVWDDQYLILSNPYIKHVRFLPGLFRGDLIQSVTLRHFASGYYRPLSMLSFMADYAVWGMNAFGFHLTNLAVHAINSFLVFLLAVRLFGDKRTGIPSALIFAAHPVHVEAVAPVFNRMGIQAAFFMLTSFWVFLRSDRLEKKGRASAAAALWVAALLSKENAVILPGIFFACDYFLWSMGRFRNMFTKRKVLFYGACAVLAAVYLFIRHHHVGRNVPVLFWRRLGDGEIMASTPLLHLLTVLDILAKYVKTVCWPFPLQPVYWVAPVRSFSVSSLFSLMLVGSLASLIVLSRRRNPRAAFLLAIFFIALLPFANIIPIADVYTFRERFLYFPSAAFCLLAGRCICLLMTGRGRTLGKAGTAFFLIIIAFFVFQTFRGNRIWRDDLVLWEAAVRRLPDSQLARLNLGQAYLRRGQIPRARQEFVRSLEGRRPRAQSSSYIAYLNLANISIESGAYEEAEGYLLKALGVAEKNDFNAFAVYDKMGLLHIRRGEKAEAGADFSRALERNPDFLTSLYNLGVLHFEKKEYNRAEALLDRALALDPDFLHAAYGLHLLYRAQKKTDQAEAMRQYILNRDPRFPYFAQPRKGR